MYCDRLVAATARAARELLPICVPIMLLQYTHCTTRIVVMNSFICYYCQGTPHNHLLYLKQSMLINVKEINEYFWRNVEGMFLNSI